MRKTRASRSCCDRLSRPADEKRSLSGRLVDTHQDEKKEINDFTGENPLVPCRPELGMINMLYAIAKGATMEGKLGNGKADLRIKASTRNGLFAFSLRLTV
ncbi:hypothetical protein [Microbispora hainanensis]|uniref:hypothetical protein n=1 Tax=Microbispora hainanensis TaxID=568844 RepID=UPI00325442CE